MAPTVEIKESTVLVILGASGDLAKKKLVSHYRSGLSAEKLLKPQNAIRIPNLKNSVKQNGKICSSSIQKHSMYSFGNIFMSIISI